ncbi:MAG: proline--tRNA ligase, partial [Schleiferiaceae bacterium]
WQEGHTAHATREEAIAEAEQMLDVYAEFAENVLAIPVVRGVKTPNERFAGALETYCIEAMMQDGKALQAGTSHFLGQNFAKAFDVKFQDRDGEVKHVWATSWGVSTRLMGALVMTHSDDNGLVLPPKLAPIQVVIVPIYRGEDELDAISVVAKQLVADLRALGVRVKYDDRDTYKPGWKFNEYELKGVPVRLAIGPRDLANGVVELARRDTLTKESVALEGLAASMPARLAEIQQALFDRALAHREANMHVVNTWAEFEAALDQGGFVSAHWDGTPETEERIKELTKATIRCIPLNNPLEAGSCVLTGAPSTQRVLFARAY